MTSLVNYIFPKLEESEANQKIIYTFNVAIILGVSSILIFLSLILFFSFKPDLHIGIEELRLLFIPLISIISISLLKFKRTGLAKVFLVFGSLFFFSYFPLFWGRVTEETVLLNSSIIIALSAFSQFVFDYKKEKYSYTLTVLSLFILVVFSNEIFATYHPEFTLEHISNNDFFVVRLAYSIIFIVINLIIYFSVRLNQKIQSRLDANNEELEKSRSSLLNQNIQMKEFQNEVLNQNEELKAFTEELQTKNELIESKNQNLNTNYLYTKAIKDLLKNDTKIFHQYFSDFFICDQAIARVTSNLFWSKKMGDKVFFVLSDTHGNSSTSAILSVLAIKILNAIAIPPISISGLFKQLVSKIDEINKESVVKRPSAKELLELTICSLDLNTKELEVITLNQKLWVKKGDELIEIYSKKDSKSKEYTAESIVLNSGDILYLYTNACGNLKGGENGERLSIPRFKQAIMNVMNFPLNIQEEKMLNFMKEWRGDVPQEENLKFVAIKIN